jgi:dihydrolipoamide dehydrogenase
MDMTDFPESIVIVGGGVIGCEYATIFANFKKTKVYILDKQQRILPFEDEDITKVLSEKFESKGVTIHHGAELLEMKLNKDGKVEYHIQEKNNLKKKIVVEKALLCKFFYIKYF